MYRYTHAGGGISQCGRYRLWTVVRKRDANGTTIRMMQPGPFVSPAVFLTTYPAILLPHANPIGTQQPRLMPPNNLSRPYRGNNKGYRLTVFCCCCCSSRSSARCHKHSDGWILRWFRRSIGRLQPCWKFQLCPVERSPSFADEMRAGLHKRNACPLPSREWQACSDMAGGGASPVGLQP